MANIRPLRSDDPRQLGGYELLGRLGEGGQGVVYLGRRLGAPPADAGAPARQPGERVAIKVWRGDVAIDETSRARLIREVEAAKKVADYTARVLEADVTADRPYVVSEFVDGPSLQQLVTEEGPRTGGALLSLATATAMALNAIHRAGIVHRDLKPHNVLLGREGPRVIDFGIAKALDATTTLTKGLIGTPTYMAPEALNGDDVTPKADIFAWGATIAFAASGKAPFGGDSLPAVINRILNQDPDLDALPPALRGLIADCMAKDPADRPTARQILLHLLDLEERGPLDDHPTTAYEETLSAAATPAPPTTAQPDTLLAPPPDPRPPLQPPPQPPPPPPAPAHPAGSPFEPAGGAGFSAPPRRHPSHQPWNHPWGGHPHAQPTSPTPSPVPTPGPWQRPSTARNRLFLSRTPEEPPYTVKFGVVMTYIGAAVLALFGVIGLLMWAARGKDEDLGFGTAFLVLGCLLALLAVFAHRRHNWARITLTTLGVIYVLLMMLSVNTGGIVTALYVAASVILLWVGGAQKWYRSARART